MKANLVKLQRKFNIRMRKRATSSKVMNNLLTTEEKVLRDIRKSRTRRMRTF